MKHTVLTSNPAPVVSWREASCPRVTDLLTHIFSDDSSLHIQMFLVLLGSLTNTDPSSTQFQVLGCGLWKNCNRNRNQMPLLAPRLSVHRRRQVCIQIRQRQNSRSFLILPQMPGIMMSSPPLKQLCSWDIMTAAAFMASTLVQLSLAKLGGARVGHYKDM